MCKVLIEMENGCVSKVFTDREMQIIIVNRDDAFAPTIEKCDLTILPGGEKLSKHYGENIDMDDQIIFDELRKLDL
jgi:hypothetical protein